MTLSPQTALGLCLALSSASLAAQENQRHFNIPAQPLPSALDALSRQGGLHVFYPDELLRGKRSAALNGVYAPQEALAKLLAGTDVKPTFTAKDTAALKLAGDATASKSPQAPSSQSETILKPMMVTAKASDDEENDLHAKGYTATHSSTGTKTDTPLMETPMSVQVVPRAVLDDQQAIRMEDALKNVSGVVKGFGFGNGEDTFIIRGFENATNNWSMTQIYRDGALSVGAVFSMADIERVEILKGPAAMLYGRLEPGGMINVVTKRPSDKTAYSIQQQFGSYDTYRTTLGATGALTPNDTLTYRLDFEYLNKDSFRDYVYNETAFVSPKLSWKISNRTQLDFEYQYFDQKTKVDWGIPAIGNRPANIPITRFFGESSDRFPQTMQGGGVTLNHQFNDVWKLQAKYFKYSHRYVHGGSNSSRSLNEQTGDLSRYYISNAHDFNSDFVMLNITGNFTTWDIDHTLLLGGDWFDSRFTEDSIYLGPTDTNGPKPINIYNPVYGHGVIDTSNLAVNNFVEITDRWFGFYLQDQMTIAEKWHILAGARYDQAKSINGFNADRSDPSISDDSEFSPRVGVLYQAQPWLSLYASYMNGFNGPASGKTLDGSTLAPNLSRQYEAGFKTEWFEGRLTSSLVFYHLTKYNLKTALSNPELAAQGYVNQTGAAESRGIEFDLQGQLTENWNVIAAYALTDTEVTHDTDTKGGTGNQGHRLNGAPTHSGSLWAYHQFGEFKIPELSAGLGVFMVGQREGDLANSYQLPGYARVDASLKYFKPLGSSKLTVQFNIQNLLDKQYYATSRPNRVGISPGEPITFLGSVKLEF